VRVRSGDSYRDKRFVLSLLCVFRAPLAIVIPTRRIRCRIQVAPAVDRRCESSKSFGLCLSRRGPALLRSTMVLLLRLPRDSADCTSLAVSGWEAFLHGRFVAVVALPSDLLEKGILYVFGTPHYFYNFRVVFAVVIVSCDQCVNCDQGGKRTFSRGTEKESFGSRFKTTLRLCSSRSWELLRAASSPVDQIGSSFPHHGDTV
jgi:hypothetical protein